MANQLPLSPQMPYGPPMPAPIVPPMAPLGMPHMPHYAAPPRMAPPPMPYGNNYNYFGMQPPSMPQPMSKPKEKIDESKLLRTVADNSSLINSTVERFVDKETGQSRMFMPEELHREFPHIAKVTLILHKLATNEHFLMFFF